MMKIKSEVVPEVEALVGHHFINRPDLCWESLQCKGAGGIAHGNKRLALVGDGLLKLKLTMDWFATSASTEVGSKIITSRGANAHLTMCGRRIGLDHFINPNPSQKGAVSDSLVADTVEALIGAAYIDGGSRASDEVMKNLGVL